MSPTEDTKARGRGEGVPGDGSAGNWEEPKCGPDWNPHPGHVSHVIMPLSPVIFIEYQLVHDSLFLI